MTRLVPLFLLWALPLPCPILALSSPNKPNTAICETTVQEDGKAQVLCTTASPEDRSSLWSEVAIDAAKKFTVTQRQKLQELGALDQEWGPIRILGEPVTEECSLGDCVWTSDGEDDDRSVQERHTKIVHFQRHGQGYHNLICDMWREVGRPIDFDSPDPNLNPVVRPEFLDPPLTALGRQQCRSQQPLCAQLTPQLVIVSPLLRCLQTATLSFRDHLPPAIPWVSHEGCREELGLLVGNQRRSLSEIQQEYPTVDFSAIEHDQDVLWEDYGDRRETLLEKSARIYDFLVNFVRKQPQTEIAIVCHSAYLFTLLNAVMDIKEEELRNWFLTSEVRSLKMTFEERQQE